MPSSTEKLIITINALHNILRTQSNQTIKFSWPRECGGGTSPRLFSEKSNLSISLVQLSETFTTFCYYIFKPSTTKYIENKVRSTFLILLRMKLLEKQKEIWNQFLCLIFCIIFEESDFSCFSFLLVYCNYLSSLDEVINFEIKLSFPIMVFS